MSHTIPFRKISLPETLAESVAAGVAAGTFQASEALEADVAAVLGKQHALATSSATAALHLAMCALDLKRGDKVLCPVNGFVDLPEVVRHFDAEPVFVDIDPDHFAIDPDALRRVADEIAGKKLRAVIVAHVGGHPAPMQAIREVADRYNLKVIEEATELIGAPEAGLWSDMMVIGFGSRIDNTISGGMLLTDDATYFERGKLMRNHGLTYAADDVAYLYDVVQVGCEYRMNEFSALYCRELFARYDHDLERRRAIAAHYTEALSHLENVQLPAAHPDHLYTQYIVRIETNRDAFARKLKEKGIEAGVQYVPLNFTQYYKEKYRLKVFDFPVALDAFQKMMSLPIYPQLRDDEVAYICQAIESIAQHHR